MDVQTRRDISRTVELLEVKLLLSADRKSYMPPRLAQQWMTLIFDLECLKSTSSASRAIYLVAELLAFLLHSRSVL